MAPKRESSDGSTQIRGLLAYVKVVPATCFNGDRPTDVADGE